MKNFLGRYFVLFKFILVINLPGIAQSIENIRVENTGDKVLVQYDLKHDNPSEKFQVKIYSSATGFTDPLMMVKGDVGDRIIPGNDKQIVWYARQELGAFKGEVTVEIRLFESKTSFYILHPYARTSVKRASLLQLNWSGGLVDDKLEIDLYKDGKRLRSIGNNIENTGDLKWTIPQDIKPGSKYQVKLQSSEDPSINAFSGNFTIKRKVPLLAKIGPIVLIGAIVGIIVSLQEKEKEDLPAPIDPN